MRVTRFQPTDAVVWPRPDSSTIALVEDVESLDEVLALLVDLRAELAPARVLVTLDDVAQCTYTSGHAGEDERLSPPLDDIDWDDPTAVAEREEATVQFISTQLDRPEFAAEWASLSAVRGLDPREVEALVHLNRDLDEVLDDTVIVQRVPVARDDLVIAGMPNGYFTSDWNTFQNHAIVRRLARHGYRHFGIGASFLGFDRPAPPAESDVDALVADLVELYGAPTSRYWAELRSILRTHRVLLLGYTEDFATQVLD
ncbi:hypothetical protein ACFXQA_00805 [Microbacterium sp. P07]|uniref:hypothetical protein n=1 Tax=Microbacterium sp. P07 TaxID=3366952 RepID=UPI0037473A99